MVSVVLMNNQISPALGIRMGYVYLVLPISGFFIAIYAAEFIIIELKALAGREVGEEEVGEMKAIFE